MHFSHADSLKHRTFSPFLHPHLSERERDMSNASCQPARCNRNIWRRRTRVRIDRALTNTAKAFCGLGSLERLRHAAAASFAAATTTWTIGVWVPIAGTKAFPLRMHSPLCHWTVTAAIFAVLGMTLASMYTPLYGLSVGGRSPSWLVNLNSCGRGKRSSARPGPLSWYQSLPHIHSTPLPPPTPDSIPSRSITLPYRQYHGVMLAQFQTRRLTSSRAEISRQLKAKRNCHRQPQAMETTANMPSGRETALFISAC